ncbi:MAG TPA: hypothetical protein VG099_08170 [Gemmataceae bacterium]|nr:hypothetical protein [Gemmataceae bacterium]
MPLTTLSCPGCKINLRPNKPVPPGKKVKCPKCATIFVTGNGTPDPASGIQTKPRPQAPPPPRQEEEDQGWEIVDEEPGKVIEAFKVVDPVEKAPQIDYEQQAKAKDKAKPKPAAKPAPRPKERYVDEDEDDEDYQDEEDLDEEDLDEEDEEDERPRARRKTRNDGSKVLLIVLLLVGGGFVLLAAAGGVGYYLYANRHKNSGTGNEDPLAYVPSDANTIIDVDMSALLSQPAIASQIQQGMRRNNTGFLSDPKRDTGLEFNDLFDHIVVAVRASPQQPVGGVAQGTSVTIIRSKVPFDPNKVRDALKESTAERVKGKTYFKVNYPNIKAVFMPSNRILIVTDAPDATVQQIVGSDGSTPKLSADALSMIRDLEKGSAGWVVVPFEGEVKSSIQMNANAAPPEFRGLTQAVALAKCLGASFAISGGSATAQVKLHCTDEKTAKQLASQVQTLWDTQLKGVGGVQIMTMLSLAPKEVKTFFKELIDSTKFSSQGSMAQANAQVSIASLQAAIIQLQTMGAQGGGFPGMPAPGGRRGFRP